MTMRQFSILLLLCGLSRMIQGRHLQSNPSLLITQQQQQHDKQQQQFTLMSMRGGNDNKRSTTSKKKKNNNNKKSIEKVILSTALQEKDAAQALGDAIRDRADILRAETSMDHNQTTLEYDSPIFSVGWAMGASDYRRNTRHEDHGVEASTSSLVAHYFLHSHGGAHAIQSICSVMAVLTCLLSFLPQQQQQQHIQWMQRAMISAMIKHISGILAAAIMAAKAIPTAGWRTAKGWMEELALDPVSQYVSYAALILVWLTTITALPWGVKIIVLGPILLREFISMVFVMSDVLVLTSSQHVLPGTSLLHAIMSLLVTPAQWRPASAAQRQILLAKLTSRISLVMEVMVGVWLIVDAVTCLLPIVPVSTNVPGTVLKKVLSTACYVQFLWRRRWRISKLAKTIRGGARYVPLVMLDALLHPATAMGLESTTGRSKEVPLTWLDYTIMALGWEE